LVLIGPGGWYGKYNIGKEISVKYGNGARGTYDADWFRIHPKFLFHRS